jgi:hypothetical protein
MKQIPGGLARVRWGACVTKGKRKNNKKGPEGPFLCNGKGRETLATAAA